MDDQDKYDSLRRRKRPVGGLYKSYLEPGSTAEVPRKTLNTGPSQQNEVSAPDRVFQ